MTFNPSPLAAQAAAPSFGLLRHHGRFPYRPITDADGFRWPNGARLAVYLGFNIEHFAFGEGLGANLGDRKSTRLNSSHTDISRMPSSA